MQRRLSRFNPNDRETLIEAGPNQVEFTIRNGVEYLVEIEAPAPSLADRVLALEQRVSALESSRAVS